MHGLIVRKSNGDLRWYPLFKQDNNYTFYPSDKHGQNETGRKVGKGFNFEKYMIGYWTPGTIPSIRRRIGGGSSLVVLEGDGDLKYYPFRNEKFQGSGDKVGRGFSTDWDYYVAEWMGNGTSDLLVRDDNGRLRLFKWEGKEFKDLGRDEKVGDGFHKDKYPDLFPGYWRNQEYPDLLVREENGDLWLYPFNGRTFKNQGRPKKVGRGFDNDFTHFLVGEWMSNGTPDLIVRRNNGKLIRYPYGKFKGKDEYDFSDPPYENVGKGFHEDWVYIVGHWREPGKPDLILCDDDHKMRFYPFDNGKFTDLPNREKYIGKGWKFTHFWDFYPEIYS